MMMNPARLMVRHPLKNGLTLEFWDHSRPVAGDRAAAQRFLAELQPFIWRKNLDFAAIADTNSDGHSYCYNHPYSNADANVWNAVWDFKRVRHSGGQSGVPN